MRQALSKLFSTYEKILAQHPFKVQSLQAAILMGAGDVIAQAFVERDQKGYDIYRTLRFTFIGTAVGPSLYLWYSILDRVVGKNTSTRGQMITTFRFGKPFIKVALDQGIVAPIFLTVLITSNNILEGKSFEDLKLRMKEDYPDILIANYKLWPAVQIINFSFVPLQYRVLFIQTIALIWNTYLAWRLNLSNNYIKQ